MAGLFSHSVGNVIIPTDELIFFRGVGFRGVETTNQITMILPIQMATFFSPLFFFTKQNCWKLNEIWQPKLKSPTKHRDFGCGQGTEPISLCWQGQKIWVYTDRLVGEFWFSCHWKPETLCCGVLFFAVSSIEMKHDETVKWAWQSCKLQHNDSSWGWKTALFCVGNCQFLCGERWRNTAKQTQIRSHCGGRWRNRGGEWTRLHSRGAQTDVSPWF